MRCYKPWVAFDGFASLRSHPVATFDWL